MRSGVLFNTVRFLEHVVCVCMCMRYHQALGGWFSFWMIIVIMLTNQNALYNHDKFHGVEQVTYF